jgi:flagellar protein FliO/FliZ
MLFAGSTNGLNGFVQFLTVVIIFVFVVGITLVATRWIANYQKDRSLTANIEVIETFRLTANKYLQIVRIGEKYLAIAIGRDEVTMLTELSEEDIQLSAVEAKENINFAGILSKFKKQQSSQNDDNGNDDT